MSTALQAEGLGKCYRLGTHPSRGGYQRLGDALARGALAPLRWMRGERAGHEEFWALRDASFELRQGEVLGVIGRNGAGKSTLLKLLSRITAPTTGRMMLNGRVASLLEVGTGFHPELTGRENIFLNGAILGMKRAEIRARLEEIIEFAEVTRFLDTPVKRYSSGMYVRLAFAVAAHLEPEILVIDEVLAVGDAQFQAKCLGKMEDVARNAGRTVIFVSHNLAAVSRLCTRALVLDQGRIRFDGEVAAAIADYAGIGPTIETIVDLRTKRRTQPVHNGSSFTSITMPSDGQPWTLEYGEDLAIDLTLDCREPCESLELGLALHSAKGHEVASWTTRVSGQTLSGAAGTRRVRAQWKGLRLVPGAYSLALGLRSERDFEDYLAEAVRFEVLANPLSARHGVDSFHGALVPEVAMQVIE